MLVVALFTMAVWVLAPPASAQTRDRDVERIVARADALIQPANLSGALTMTLTAPGGDRRVIEAVAYQKERAAGREDRLFVFTHPPNVRDTALLVHSNLEQGADAMWIYLPALDRVKRVDLGAAGGGHFMGSDFTFRDLVSRDEAEYVHALLPETRASADFYVVEVRGRTSELQREFGYSREEHFIRKDNFMRERVVFYDLAGDKLKEMTVHAVHEAAGFAFPSQVRMRNVQTGHVSEIVFDGLSFCGRDPRPHLHPALPAAEVGRGCAGESGSPRRWRWRWRCWPPPGPTTASTST